MNSHNSPTTKPLFKGTQIVWYLLSILQVALIFRFAFKLMGANPEAVFTSFVYGLTWLFTVPFLAVFPAMETQGGVFEWTTLLAMLVYWMIAVAIVRIFLMSKTVSTEEAAVELEKQDG